jgi:hypothetical protein
METRDYRDVLQSLMEHYCLNPEDIIFVENVHDWCIREGIEEPDKNKPVKLITPKGKSCRIVINESIPDSAVENRIKAMSIRGALQNVALDRAALLNSEKKKLTYLFISEFATSLPDLEGDELLADNWAFEEMKKMGFFKE